MTKIDLYTIGFTQKSAEDFFAYLEKARIKRMIDVRLNNASQLAGFTKKSDFIYFLKIICGCGYRHETLLAPTKEILEGYKKKKIGWAEYEKQFNELMRTRKAHTLASPAELHRACLLCSEPTPENCHRRLVAEYMKDHFGNLEIKHL
jgi:uncharacterized protein (DUF488 family)